MPKYNFSVEYTNKASGLKEKIEVTGCDSLDDANRIMDNALRDRKIAIDSQLKKPEVKEPQQPAQQAPTPTGPKAPETVAANGPATSDSQPA